jgi:hypothetical protein
VHTIRGVPTPRGRAFTVLDHRIADAEPAGNADRSLDDMAHTAEIVPFWPPWTRTLDETLPAHARAAGNAVRSSTSIWRRYGGGWAAK